jgi:rare lipoprotein A
MHHHRVHHSRHAHVDRSGGAQTGVASYYSERAVGKKTASGARLRRNQMTAASRTLPLGSKATVTNRENGKSVSVTVTDRGPFAKGRIMDVSPLAASRLGMKKQGTAHVHIRPHGQPKTPHRGR